jgi:shikimate kinase
MKTDCIFLFGPRAVGKSSVATELTKALPDWQFLDMDYEFRLRFPENSRNNGSNGSDKHTAYYEGCRTVLLENLKRERVIFALAGGTFINDTTPETAIRNLQDCRCRGQLVLLLPSRFNARCKRILHQRERRRSYALTKDIVSHHFDSRVPFMREYADFTVYGTSPERIARRIIRRFNLN